MVEFRSKMKTHRFVIESARKELVAGALNLVYGKSIQFQNYSFSTDKKEEIDYLRNHPENGIKFFEMDSPEEKTKKQKVG